MESLGADARSNCFTGRGHSLPQCKLPRVSPWSTEEIEATVAAYFEMLRLELAGLP